jgi:uncharacterized protein (DUF2062 family)
MVKKLLSYGTSPSKIAITITLGMMFGTIPIWGVSTIILAAIALLLRLNMVIIQLANYLVYPIQLLLYLPFLKLGGILSSKQAHTLSYGSIMQFAKTGWTTALAELGTLHLWGLIIWLIFWLPLSVLSYSLLLKIINKKKAYIFSGYKR